MCTTSDPFRSKIGMTTGSPLRRLKQLRCGDPYLALYAAFLIPKWYGDIFEVEANIHYNFSGHRITFSHTNEVSEWFSLAPASVINHLCIYFERTGEIQWALNCLDRSRSPMDQQCIMLVGNNQLAYDLPILPENGRLRVQNRNLLAALEMVLPERDD